MSYCPACKGTGIESESFCENCKYYDNTTQSCSETECLYNNYCPYCEGTGEILDNEDYSEFF